MHKSGLCTRHYGRCRRNKIDCESSVVVLHVAHRGKQFMYWELSFSNNERESQRMTDTADKHSSVQGFDDNA